MPLPIDPSPCAVAPDTGLLGAVADRLDGQADAVRLRAARLGAATVRVRWHGLAATAFDDTALGVVTALRRAAGGLDAAAAALRRHGVRSEQRARELALLARAADHAAERVVVDAAGAAERVAGDAAGAVGDAARAVARTVGDAGHVAESVGSGVGRLIGLG